MNTSLGFHAAVTVENHQPWNTARLEPKPRRRYANGPAKSCGDRQRNETIHGGILR